MGKTNTSFSFLKSIQTSVLPASLLTLPCAKETVNEDGGSSMSWTEVAIYPGMPGLKGRTFGCSTRLQVTPVGLWDKWTEDNGESLSYRKHPLTTGGPTEKGRCSLVYEHSYDWRLRFDAYYTC